MSERCVNLTFHGIGEQTRRLEPGEEEVWASTAQFRAILDAVAHRDGVRISFDDGNSSDLRLALPELRRRGLRATFFLVAGRLATPGFLDESGIRELADAGMTIGCHGMRHRPWRALGAEDLRDEHRVAKERLEQVIQQQVTQAACPFGAYDRQVLRSLRRHGYERVFTSDGGTSRAGDWLQARNSVHRGDDPSLLARIPALERPLAKALGRRTKLAVKRWR